MDTQPTPIADAIRTDSTTPAKDRLRMWCALKNLTQAEAAEAIGVSVSTLAKALAGGEIGTGTIKKIHLVVGIPAGDWLTRPR